MENRGHWASNVGFILAAAGSAVGLGNIWKFPRLAYGNGGGAFILLYLIIVFTIGATVMLTEFAAGRHAQKNAVGALRAINKRWSFIGGMGVLTGFIILSYYSHVGGWVLKYVVEYITGANKVYSDPVAFFLVDILGKDTSFPVQGALIYPFIFIAFTAFIVIKGVSGGIEKINKVLMPALFVLLIILAVRGITIPGAAEGLKFLFYPDFSKVDGGVLIAALGQAFFSLSLGMGVMCTYGSYLRKEENLTKNTLMICSLDTLVALLSGLSMIPIAFIAGIEIAEGGNAGFAFISLASAFHEMPFGTAFGALFYILLLFAALTSAISILEGTVAYVSEELKIHRTKAAIGLSVIMFFIGILYTVSQVAKNIKGIWLDAGGVSYPVFGDFMEFLTDKLLMPVGALLFCVVVGWSWGMEKASEEISSSGRYAFKLRPLYAVMVKFVAPVGILLILLSGFGVI